MAKRYQVCGYKWMRNITLKKGQLVTIRGIISKPHWNDTFGVICGDYDFQSGRYPVKLINYPKESGKLRKDCIMAVQLETREFRKHRHVFIHLIAVFNHQIDRKICGNCWKSETVHDTKFKQCKGCKAANTRKQYIIKYCSRKCQKRHWHIHKQICRLLYSSKTK